MAIIRLIYVRVEPGQAAEAERLWKQDCAPLMIRQPGCRSERLLKCLDEPGAYISYSEWDSEDAIDRYRKSEDHKTIQAHARAIHGAKASVMRYETVG
jgi:heme-degrading monooxygenase HmoA